MIKELFGELRNVLRWPRGTLAKGASAAYAPVEGALRRGVELQKEGFFDAAAEIYSAVLRNVPDSASALQLLSTVELSRGNHDLAEVKVREALEISPDSVECINTLGTICLATARHDDAFRLFQRALVIDPNALRPRSNLLFLSNLLPGMSREQAFEEHCNWARIHADPLMSRPLDSASAESPVAIAQKRIRVGYVSGDLWEGHPVGKIMSSMLPRHDRDRFEIYCYNSTNSTDELNVKLRGHVDCWRDVGKLGDEGLASGIKADGVDILIDLSGHTRNNRLDTFARRPASTQVTWLGYLNTTGMRAMDWRLAAERGESGDSNRYHSERLWLHEGMPWPWAGGTKSIVTGEAFAETRRVVLASFNHFHKLNDQVLDTWAQVLTESPEAILRFYGVPKGNSVERMFQKFEGHRIDPGRIEVFGKMDYAQYQLECAKADIALDPFPYNGGATTCESLFVGTPVVSLAGQQGFSRTGASILSAIGLHGLICDSIAEYRNTIREMIKDANHPYRRRQEVRQCVREAFQRESDRFVPEFERAIAGMVAAVKRGGAR